MAGHVTTSSVNTFAVYQPQVDNWHADLVNLYCGVELKTGKQTASNYGVVWIQARTEVDKVNRLVTLDQLEAALEADSEAAKGVEVKNDPPRVIIASKPQSPPPMCAPLKGNSSLRVQLKRMRPLVILTGVRTLGFV